MDWAVIKVKFDWDMDIPTVVSDLHKIYAKHGFEFNTIDCFEDESITYEEACTANQFCFDNHVEYEDWKHYRLYWGWNQILPEVETMPVIEVINFDDRCYDRRRQEWILFPYDDLTEDMVSHIFDLMYDLYKVKGVVSLEFQKE